MRIHSSSLTFSTPRVQQRQNAEAPVAKNTKPNELLPVQPLNSQNQNNQNPSSEQPIASNKSLTTVNNLAEQPTNIRTIKALNSYSQETRQASQGDSPNFAPNIDFFA
ncbi:MAG: hypothetical protein WC782_04140 [Methylococcaceae bacterium]|jgi:endo-beta-N-acetylglucosaminidase D